MKRTRKKRIVRRKRRISEREIMRIKRKLKKSARKLRLGAKRTGAYVYGTLRRIVGNPGLYSVYIDSKTKKIGSHHNVGKATAGKIARYFRRLGYIVEIKRQSGSYRGAYGDKHFSIGNVGMWKEDIQKNPGRLSGVNKTLGWLNAATYPPERKLLLHLAKKDGWRDVEIKRKSKRPFDISIEGVMGDGMRFRADLKLYAIRALTDWPRPEIAMMSDYPQMVMEGDWSGIRDSSDMAIARIFYWAIIKGHGLAK